MGFLSAIQSAGKALQRLGQITQGIASPGAVAQSNALLAATQAGRSWHGFVSGKHWPSGLSNDTLSEYLAAGGRDALDPDVPQLKRLRELNLQQFLRRAGVRAVSARELEDEDRKCITEWCIQRATRGGTPGPAFKPLTRMYAVAKKKRGFYGPPGFRTGAYAMAVANHLKITFYG